MSSTSTIVKPVPFNQAYWVEPGRFMAGCYPGAEHPDEARDKLSSQLSPETDAQIELVCSWRAGE